VTDPNPLFLPPEPIARRVVIDTPQAYRDAVAVLAAGHGPFGVDAERASGFRYSQRAYLVQVFRRGAGSFLFDPPAIGDFSALSAVMAGEEWILHAASQDLPCLRELGLDPSVIFDTELGARLAGLPRVGLGAVVEDLLGIHLKKEHSAADWSTRPLPHAWLEYAALDVELLPDLRDSVAERLAAGGKLEAAQQEFQAVLDKQPVERTDAWRRLTGLHTIRSPRALAIARALWRARDDYAREIDSAPGRLVPDAALVAAAAANPATKRDLAQIKAFTGRASRSQLDRWFAAIEAGRAEDDLPVMRPPSDQLPPPRIWGDRNPEADLRLRGVRPQLAELAESMDLPLENLLTPDIVRRIAWSPPQPIAVTTIASALAGLGARPWQIHATAELISRVFLNPPQLPPTPSEQGS